MSSSDDDQEHYQYKVIVLGNGAVGKSSIIHQFCDGDFAQNYKQTIGLDFATRRLTLQGNVFVTLQIWDIGGQQIGGKMLGNYIGGSHAIVFVYDITNPDSLKDLDDWYSFVAAEFKGSTKKPLMVMAGNKMDLVHLREVKPEKHASFANERNLTPFLVSAKTGDRINGMFTRIAADLSGVSLTKGEVDMTETKVTAPIVLHPAAPVAPDVARGPSKKDDDDSICSIQ